MADKKPENIPSALHDFVIGNIQLEKQIGRGANGRILEAKWEGITVAVKEIHSIFINEVSEPEFQAFKTSFLLECEQSSRLRHPNIVRFFGIYYPPGARVPSLVMERLHCSLTNLLERNPLLPIETKLSIINDVALGLRYLHTRTPIIIHRDLSSNNVLISKGMEGKIGDLGTARLVDPTRQSQMTKAPGTVDFMPPEALAASGSVRYEKELDVFSLCCVMLHTLSHQWPTPSEPVVTDPVTFEVKGRTEVERRRSHLDKIEDRAGMLIPTIKSCLNNIPENRVSIVQVCSQLEGLVAKQDFSTDETDLPLSYLQQEIKRKDAEIRERDTQIQIKDIQIQRQAIEIKKALTADMVKLQMHHDPALLFRQVINCNHKHYLLCEYTCYDMYHFQVSKSSSDFWNSLTLTWNECADLPVKCCAASVAELDGKVYVAVTGNSNHYFVPLVYDCYKHEWSVLPELPYARFSLVAVPCKNQLLAIGGLTSNDEVSNKVFAWGEDNKRWTTPYPNMSTARCRSSCISHGSSVIVAGGVLCLDPWTLTGAVEVLHIKEHRRSFSKSQWSIVQQLPDVVGVALPMTIDDELYIVSGYDNDGDSTRNIVTASLPELLQSSDKKTGNVWHKLPDMPYSSWAITHQGCLIILNGDHLVEQSGVNKSVWKLAQQSYLYNPNTKSWDYVGDDLHDYKLGIPVCIGENKIFFIGGETSAFDHDKDDMVNTCAILTFKPK